MVASAGGNDTSTALDACSLADTRFPVVLFRGCRRQPLYCFHLDFRCVTFVRYIYIYIYNMDLKKSLIIENLYYSNREV